MNVKTTSNCVKSQRNKILNWLRTSPLTMLQARSELDIMHPAARVQELKEQGHNIFTHWDRVNGHRIAKYVLFAGSEVNG